MRARARAVWEGRRVVLARGDSPIWSRRIQPSSEVLPRADGLPVALQPRQQTNRTQPAMTAAVALPTCATDSDSLLRLAAYLSLPFGAQALWWEGLGGCAPVGYKSTRVCGMASSDSGGGGASSHPSPLRPSW